MKSSQSSQREGWPWSPNLDLYDRTPELSQSELNALEFWSTHHGRGYQSLDQQTEASLYRLVKPLRDTIAQIELPTIYDGSIPVQLIFLAMHQRQSSFWAWSTADWLEILCRNHQEFRKRFQQEHGRQHVLAIIYVLLGFMEFWGIRFEKCSLAFKVFGRQLVESEIERLLGTLKEQGYGAYGKAMHKYRAVICEALLSNRSPYLEDLTAESLDTARQKITDHKHRQSFVALSVALERLGILKQSLSRIGLAAREPGSQGAMEAVAPEWGAVCQQWLATSTLALSTRQGYFYRLMIAGRWVAETYPTTTHPRQWTKLMASEFVAAVNQMKVGDYSNPSNRDKIGTPFSAWTKSHTLATLRTFFQDCQDWEWIPATFNPLVAFATPKSVKAILHPSPRQIEDEVWARLLTAGLNLSSEDFGSNGRTHWYPLEMVQALVVVWLFCALRQDDIRNLRVGCVRWVDAEIAEIPEEDATLRISPEGKVCLLEIPSGKTGHGFTKPVDALVGKAIECWEAIRPNQAPLWEDREAKRVHFLFTYRAQQLGHPYLNETLIPLLCEKAGVPEVDVRGQITSHRGRHTILTQLSESMTLPELQGWSGHKSLETLQHYLQPTLKKQVQAYEKAGYLKQNLRSFAGLVDAPSASSGSPQAVPMDASQCSYEFFEHCPQTSCAQCQFYQPPNLAHQRLLEQKVKVQQLLGDLQLTEQERSVISEGLAALNQACEKLQQLPSASEHQDSAAG